MNQIPDFAKVHVWYCGVQYTEGTLPGGISDGDDDEEEHEEEGEEEAAADEAIEAATASGEDKAAPDAVSQNEQGVVAPAPAVGAELGDLLSFGDSGPVPSANESSSHARKPSEDMFGLNALRADLPGGSETAAAQGAAETTPAANLDDPFLGGISQESATTHQTAPQGAGTNPFAEMQQSSAAASVAFQSQTVGPAPPAPQNPFGANAFPPSVPAPSAAPPVSPSPGTAHAPAGPGPQQPFPGPQQGSAGQQAFLPFGAGPSGQGPQPAQGPPPGQYGPPQPFMGVAAGGIPPPGYAPPPGYQMYGQPAPGWGQPPTGQPPGPPPNPFGGSAFPPPGGMQQYGGPPPQYGAQGQFGVPGFPGGMPQQPNPFGGPGATAPMQPHFGASATGMPAPGYSAPPANPFMASSTGYGQQAWNPNAQKDAFQVRHVRHVFSFCSWL